MARQFPRFLFSNPKNTKSEGPFIIHTLYPQCIFKVNGTKNKPVVLLLEFLCEVPLELMDKGEWAATYKAATWLDAQISSGEIDF